MGNTYKGTLKDYLTKNKKIREMIEFDYFKWLESEDCLIKKRIVNDKTFYFVPKSKEPIRSFSSLTKGLFGSWIPEFALKKAAEYGNNLMENITNFHLSNGYFDLVGNEKDENIFNAFLKFLEHHKLKIFSVEKFFINQETQELGYVDLFCIDRNGKFILVEIKTRNDLEISNQTIAQAYFYKKNFHNVKSMVLQINRKNFEYKAIEVDWKKGKKYLKLIRLFNEPKKWDNYKIIS